MEAGQKQNKEKWTSTVLRNRELENEHSRTIGDVRRLIVFSSDYSTESLIIFFCIEINL